MMLWNKSIHQAEHSNKQYIYFIILTTIIVHQKRKRVQQMLSQHKLTRSIMNSNEQTLTHNLLARILGKLKLKEAGVGERQHIISVITSAQSERSRPVVPMRKTWTSPRETQKLTTIFIVQSFHHLPEAFHYGVLLGPVGVNGMGFQVLNINLFVTDCMTVSL